MRRGSDGRETRKDRRGRKSKKNVVKKEKGGGEWIVSLSKHLDFVI